MKQKTLGGFEKFGKTTRRAKFLGEMERIMPWKELTAAIEPVYPQGGGTAGGRPPMPLERMLRIYFLQLWFNLSDPAVEEALYDSASMRSFAGVDLGREAAPDETTICKFRHLLERHGLGKTLLQATNRYLRENGMKIGTGTIVDATIISAPSSTRNRDRERDPEMHQTAKGRQWYFGMKAHVGVDSKTKFIHTILASAANVADRDALPHLLHGKETRVWGDQAYQGQTAVIRRTAPRARDLTNRRYRFGGRIDGRIKACNRRKSSVRAKVEHSIGIIKRVFGFQKVRYRGLAKNLHRLEVTAALANLFMARKRLLHARA
ncbi:MAG: IS5 family transposase [Rhodocyclaceae bacterium]|nr:IS5 family transposase [Rhodocyclaceae bacterium]